MTNPIDLMGPTTYSRLVQHLISFDKLIAECKENHAAAVAAKDEIIAGNYIEGIKAMEKLRDSVEDQMRRIEPGKR